jgi:hypothetical protein
MPNWCTNIINCSGPPEDIAELIQFVKGDDDHATCGHKRDGEIVNSQPFSFKKIIPYQGEWDWEWCHQNWGTKWDACEVKFFFHGDEVCYRFETAWSPPVPIFNVLNKKFSDLYISWFYHEPMMEIAGYINNDRPIKKDKTNAL